MSAFVTSNESQLIRLQDLMLLSCLQKEAGDCKIPGNKIPIIRGIVMVKKQFDDLVQSCKDLLKPEIGYDEGRNSSRVFYAKAGSIPLLTKS